MPATDSAECLLTTFLNHMDKLSPELSEQWKAIAGKAP